MLYKLTNSIRLEKVYENKEIKPRTKFEEKYSPKKKLSWSLYVFYC